MVLLLSLRLLAESRADGEVRRLDVLGALLATVAVVLLAYGPVAGQEEGWGSPRALGALVLAVVLLALIRPIRQAHGVHAGAANGDVPTHAGGHGLPFHH